MAVTGRSATNQGYPTTTQYKNYALGNIRDRGYSSSMDGYTSGYSTSGNLRNRGYYDSASPGYRETTPSNTSTNTNTNTKKPTGGTTKKTTTSYNTTSAGYPTTTTYAEPEPTYETQQSAPSFDAAAAYRQLLEAYKNQESSYQDYLDQMREAAQKAYDRGVGSLDKAYAAQLEALSGNLDSQKAQLLDAYNRSRQGLDMDAETAYKQAYINNMMNRRNVAQQLSAMGINGGAAESNIVGMANNYGNARNNIATTKARNVSDLEGNYNNNLAAALQAYNSAVADSNMQKAQQLINLENALASNNMNAMSNYQNMLQNNNAGYLDVLRSAIASGVNPYSGAGVGTLDLDNL